MTIRLPDKTNVIPVLAIAPQPKEEEQVPVNPLMIAQKAETVKSEDFMLQAIPEPDTTSKALTTLPVSRIDSSDLDIEFVQTKHPAIGYIRVEPEETLGHYSDWLQIKTQRVRNWNNLSFRTAIRLNQKIKLIFNTISADDFNRKRMEYHRGIEEDFFMNYEITGTVEHRVKNGENIWYLCNYEYNLPYWLVVDYNKDMDFEALRAGDKLIIPSINSRKL
jgi:membrane-bound lytic murein transglycosylase D